MNGSAQLDKILSLYGLKIRFYDFLTVTTMIVLYMLIASFVLILLDHKIFFNDILRIILFVAFLVPPVILVIKNFSQFFRRMNPMFIMKELEKNWPEMQQVIQKDLRNSETFSPEIQKLIQKKLKLHAPPSIVKNVQLLGLIVFLVILYFIASITSIPLSYQRVLTPWAEVQLPTKTRIDEVSPADDALLITEKLFQIKAKVSGFTPESGYVRYRYGKDDEWQKQNLQLSQEGVFVSDFAARPSDFEYQVYLGDSKSQVRTVRLRQNPVMNAFEVEVIPPAYLKQESSIQKSQNLIVPVNSRVKFKTAFDQDVTRTKVLINSYVNQLKAKVDSNKYYSSEKIKVSEDSKYHFTYVSEYDKNLRSPEFNIRVVLDDVPKIKLNLLNPKHQYIKAENLKFSVSAKDDWALRNVKFHYQSRYNEEVKGSLSLLKNAQQKSYQKELVLNLSSDFKANDGDIFLLYLEAEDYQEDKVWSCSI